MDSYQYPPLSGPRCTRVIRLHPGATKDPSCPLSCDLDEIDLDNPSEYLALSYTWNGETPSQPLTIGNAQVDTSQLAGSQLLITPNCAAALRVFRKSFHRRINRRKSLTLWVDAICINQRSNDDKSSQVAMMAEIFEHAKRVVVWLGNQDSPPRSTPLLGSLACAVLPNVNIGRLSDFFIWAERSKALRWIEPQVERLEALTADAIFNNCCDRNTFNAILRSPYWTRVWTVQEFANTHVSILCQNSSMISFAGMMKMIRHSNSSGHLSLIHGDVYECCRAFGHFDSDPFMDGHFSLQYLMELQAAEPRDRIFAFRAMSHDVLAKIRVDYQRPLQDLFTETSMVVIKETNKLYLLYFSSLYRTSPGLATGSMPSWSLDFGAEASHQDQYRGAHMDQRSSSYASRGSHPRISFPNAGISLRVRGKSVGVIGGLTGNIDSTGNSCLMEKTAMRDESQQVDDDVANSVPTTKESYSNRLRELMVYFISILRQHLGAALLEAKMAQTLFELTQSITGGHVLPVTIPSLAPNATFEDLLEALCDDSDIGASVKYNMGEGRMFFTTDGRAGLGVPRLSEGDEVFLIAGLNHPFVLRPHGDNGEYTLVGPAVVTGMMKGELWPDDESELRDIDIV